MNTQQMAAHEAWKSRDELAIEIYPGSRLARPLGISREEEPWIVARHPDGQWVRLAKLPGFLRHEEIHRGEVESAQKVIDSVYRHCRCHEASQKGFDYGEPHPLLGNAGPGKRWQTPREIIDAWRLSRTRAALSAREGEK